MARPRAQRQLRGRPARRYSHNPHRPIDPGAGGRSGTEVGGGGAMSDKPDKALTFAEQINAAHQEHVKFAKGTLDHGIKAGELLILAKETVDAENGGKRGKWEDWLNDHCPDIPET